MQSADRFRFLMLPICLLPLCAAAEERPGAGVWKGTIDKLDVIACIDSEYPDSPEQERDFYYYRKYGVAIALHPNPDEKLRWTEGERDAPSGVWKMSKPSNQSWQGQWLNGDGSSSSSVKLHRYEGIAARSRYCSIDDNPALKPEVQSRVDDEPISRGAFQYFGVRRYRSITAQNGHIQSLEVVSDTQALRRLNRLLRDHLKLDVAFRMTCEAFGEPGQYDSSISVHFWDANWLSLELVSDGYCGGAYPFHDNSMQTWSVQGGEPSEIDPRIWIRGDTKTARDSSYRSLGLPAKLRELVVDQMTKNALEADPEFESHQDPDRCGPEQLRENELFQLMPGSRGMTFETVFPHASQACTERIEIPYSRLLPFLTAEGKRIVRGITTRGAPNGP